MSFRLSSVMPRSLWGAAMALGLGIAGAGAQAQPDGAALFEKTCAVCHQVTAIGTVGLAPSLKGPHWDKLGADRSYLPTVLTKGLSGAIVVNGERFVGSMPLFESQLDNASLAAIASHLRELQGATGEAPYTEADFERARAQPGNPAQTRLLRAKILGN